MNIRVNPHVIPGMAQAESISFFTGLTMRWFRDAFCAEEKLIAERLGVDAYSLLEEMASRVPAGSHGVMPIFSDAMHFKQWYHAAPSFINLSIDPEKCNKATLFRALEENAAIVSACNLAQISQFSGVTFDSWCLPAAALKARCGARSSATSPACRCGCRWSAKPPRWAAPSPPEPAPDCMAIWPAPENG